MSLQNPYETYKNNAVNMASPAELTLKLYNGCLKFMKLGKQALEENNMQEKHKNLMKAQQIIQYLHDTLDHSQEISESIASLYQYLLGQLALANIKNDQHLLKEVEGFITEFRDTWKQMMQQNSENSFSSKTK